ncbi:MAG: hypothetical protein ACKUBY_03850 [Candidatus Moraniibacteriota bacterium]|jgi:hypothetical protein
MSEVKFVDGLMVKKPHQNAPDFVKGSLSIKREELINWLQGESGEWINIDIKESQKGSWYAQVNDWQPQGGQGGGQQEQSQQPQAGEQPQPPKDLERNVPTDIDMDDIVF